MLGINVLSELQAAGIKYQFSGEQKVKIQCPFHHDETPSAEVFIKDERFKCYAAGCGKSGDLLTLFAGKRGLTRAKIKEELQTRYSLTDDDKIIEIEVVEKYHAAIWSPAAEELRAALYDRAITDDDIRQYRLGLKITTREKRIVIPIKNASGEYVNLQKYIPGAPGNEKMRQVKGRTQLRFFPIEQLQYRRLAIVGGLIKAIAAARVLNPHGIGAISTTGGEGAWHKSLSDRIAGYEVVYIGDIDNAGQLAADKICSHLIGITEHPRNGLLPLPRSKYPKGDVNDFIRIGGNLLEVYEKAENWKPKQLVTNRFDDESNPISCELNDAVHAKMTGKRVSLPIVVTALMQSPYTIPAKVKVICDRSDRNCNKCPVSWGQEIHTVPPEHPSIIGMSGASQGIKRSQLRDCLGIPASCQVWQPDELEHHNVNEGKVSERLDIASRNSERPMQNALFVGPNPELNGGYDITARMHANPQNQQATLLISSYKPTENSLSLFEIPPDAEKLKLFQPKDWTIEGIDAKLQELYDDWAYSVTRVFGRRWLHECVDLIYHTSLNFLFEGERQNGWGQLLIIGDSSQGKSKVTQGLRNFFGLGGFAESKNASVAGLLGGLQQMSGKWYLTWGAFVRNDRGLLLSEELKGCSTETIGKLTEMRSSGIAQIIKIEKREAYARTRWIVNSNPRSDRPMASYSFGVQAARELIGGLEDLRRFDLVLGVAAGEVPPSVRDVPYSARPAVPHRHTAELCRTVCLWAWTRTEEQIYAEPEALDAVYMAAQYLATKYSESIPIIDSGSTKHKIFRLAIGLAARTFSCTDDFQCIIVRKCHVDYICKLVDSIYSSHVLAYDEYSISQRTMETITEGDTHKVIAYVLTLKNSDSFLEGIASKPIFDHIDIQNWCEFDLTDARICISQLVRFHAIDRAGNNYKKTAAFTSLLRQIRAMSRDDRSKYGPAKESQFE